MPYHNQRAGQFGYSEVRAGLRQAVGNGENAHVTDSLAEQTWQHLDAAVEIYRPYKFVVTMENSDTDGYIRFVVFVLCQHFAESSRAARAARTCLSAWHSLRHGSSAPVTYTLHHSC